MVHGMEEKKGERKNKEGRIPMPWTILQLDFFFSFRFGFPKVAVDANFNCRRNKGSTGKKLFCERASGI